MKNQDFGFLSFSLTFTISNFFTRPMQVRQSGCSLYLLKELATTRTLSGKLEKYKKYL